MLRLPILLTDLGLRTTEILEKVNHKKSKVMHDNPIEDGEARVRKEPD